MTEGAKDVEGTANAEGAAEAQAVKAADEANEPEPTANEPEPTAVPVAKTVVCIGDSITSGNVPGYDEPDPWPAFLQVRLYEQFDEWTLTNLGVSGTTLLSDGVYPYSSTGNLEVAEALAPDVAIVMLGTNDSYGSNWAPGSFRDELSEMVEKLKAARPDTRIVLMAPPSVFCDPDPNSGGIFHMNDEIIGDEIRPIVEAVAKSTGAQFVDLYGLTESHPEWFPDTVHPNGAGNRAIAAYVYDEVFA